MLTRCYQSQDYKIWKQFTTQDSTTHWGLWLLSIAKLQNLKAIHNQLLTGCQGSVVVINHKTTKFESNSQQPLVWKERKSGCYQSQNYKIWKQFTTSYCLPLPFCELLSITKLQNLKAIHNLIEAVVIHVNVVINHKTTKFESNSQHKCLIYQIVQQ